MFEEFNNTYERIQAEEPLGIFMKRLYDLKKEKLHNVLKNPKEVIAAWNRLAKRLGVLQTNCTVVGKMNDEYSL